MSGGAGQEVDPRMVFIMDDCLFDDRWVRDVNIRSIFMNGRHMKIMFIFTMQYPLGVPPVLRANIDYVFILREHIVSNRNRIYDNYCGMLPSFDIFCTVLDNTTENKAGTWKTWSSVHRTEAMDELGLVRYCCRRHFLSQVDLIERI
eukprot:jgi/Tetstr1/432145/TSEL_021602.t1